MTYVTIAHGVGFGDEDSSGPATDGAEKDCADAVDACDGIGD